jgi:hypothetical protein
MRILFAAPLLLVATPAVAREAPPPGTPDARTAAALLGNPHVQDALATLVTRMSDALLDTHVGPLATLAPDGDIAPGDTLGDLAARRDPHYRRHMYDDTRHAAATAGRAAGAAVAMSDELAATADRLRHVLDGVGDIAPSDR